MKLVSFLIPTRSSSTSNLRDAVRSIYATAAENADDIEVLFRIDDDDAAKADEVGELINHYGCRCVVGPRGGGYNSMGVFVNDLAKIADSKWCWLFDDDAWIDGDWYNQLAQFPCDHVHGPAVNAENYYLGESLYKNGPTGGCVGLLMPTKFCKALDHGYPVDQVWMDEINRMGWAIRQLAGVSYHHCGRKR